MAGHIWLIGMMGSGKSAVGRLLAERLDRPHYDTDDEVTARTGCSIAQLWGERGEQAFRDMEAAAVARLADAEASVISTGGGVVLAAANVAVMQRTGLVVWLTADPATLAGRVAAGAHRPLLADVDDEERLTELLAERTARYEAAANQTVATTGIPVGVVVDRIEELWNAY